jgi:hypothetical protein
VYVASNSLGQDYLAPGYCGIYARHAYIRMRLKKIEHVICGLVICLVLCATAEALELKMDDISASVEVAPTFGISLDNSSLYFGLLKPGDTKILGEGRFFNQIRCRSNSGRPWFLKAQIVSLSLLEKEYVLPVRNLKWKIAESTGSAQLLGGYDFQSFSTEPLLLYASQGDDDLGKEVVLSMQYSLASPPDAPAGNYTGQIVFTMTESP